MKKKYIDGTTKEEIRKEALGMDKVTEGKVEYRLLNKEFLEEMARVRMYGNAVHKGEESWRLASDMEYIEAAMRHLLEIMEAYKRKDWKRLYDESTFLHTGHVGDNMMFVTTRIKEALAAGYTIEEYMEGATNVKA